MINRMIPLHRRTPTAQSTARPVTMKRRQVLASGSPGIYFVRAIPITHCTPVVRLCTRTATALGVFSLCRRSGGSQWFRVPLTAVPCAAFGEICGAATNRRASGTEGVFAHGTQGKIVDRRWNGAKTRGGGGSFLGFLCWGRQA